MMSNQRLALRVPILVYHSMNISGNDYINNNHIALREDLELLTALGWNVVPLHDIVNAYLHQGDHLPLKTIALTFDDGPDFDYHDLPHPAWGVQRSMLHILQDFKQAHHNKQPSLHATAFVIASPAARHELDKTCMIGKSWWNDDWWQGAVASGLMSIANHSWDHNHMSLDQVAQNNQTKGNFEVINTKEAADAQIKAGLDYVRQTAPNPGDALFAYPYGEANPYLLTEYLADYKLNPGVLAAFGTQGEVLTEASYRWHLPRFVCGQHWKTPDDLRNLLSISSC